jgi:ubiquitin C-terminal hydrolase
MECPGLAGLANIGNTCYANSVLQVLRVIPEWSALMEREDVIAADADLTSRKIFLAYQDIARTLWSKEAVRGAICRPMAFWKDVREAVAGTVYESFREPRPQDAHEFLIYLLDQCNESLKVKTEDPLYASLGGYKSPVTDLLFGWDKVSCICGECGHASVRYEPFNMLKVGLNNQVTDPAALFAADRVDEELEGYACEKCAPVRTNATIKRSLWRLPKTLFYVLKRFTPDGRKDNTAFHYDGDPISFADHFAADAPADRNTTFRPIGSIDHMGMASGGHYVAQVYHPVLREWFTFDDERCSTQAGPRYSVMTYIIVFSATDTNLATSAAATASTADEDGLKPGADN